MGSETLKMRKRNQNKNKKKSLKMTLLAILVILMRQKTSQQRESHKMMDLVISIPSIKKNVNLKFRIMMMMLLATLMKRLLKLSKTLATKKMISAPSKK
jgi:hypothetical protein